MTEMLEFLKTTNNRNLRNNFHSMVEQRLKEWEHSLQLRREKLFCQLRSEQLEWSQALTEWVQARAETALRQRQEWIGLEMLKRERADQELLKLKQQQYEVENCSQLRELQSKQILLETKTAQRYQIEERKALRRKEQQIDQMWLKAWQRLHAVRAQQEDYEQKLRRIIANATQAENSAKEEAERQKKNIFNHCKFVHSVE